MPNDTYICPACGSEVVVGSKSCPKCNPPKPWEEEPSHDGLNLDLPEDDTFDYQSFIEDEFGGGRKPRGRALLWCITGIILLVGLALSRFFF